MHDASPARTGFDSIPNPERERVLLQVNPALGASVRIIPSLHPVQRGNGTLEVIIEPQRALRSQTRQAIQSGLEAGGNVRNSSRNQSSGAARRRGASRDGTLLNLEPNDGVVELLAVAAQDRLHEQVEPPVRATGDSGAVTASWAFKPVRPSHTRRSSVFG